MTEEQKREKLEDGLKHLGEPVTDQLSEAATGALKGFLWRGALERRHVRQYMCSLCGATFETDAQLEDDVYNEYPITSKTSHDDLIECPVCGRSVVVYDAWRMKNHICVPMFFEYWRKSAVDKDVLVGIGARVWSDYGEPWTTAKLKMSILSFAVMKYGRKGTRYVTDGNGFRVTYDLASLDNGFVGSRRILDEDSVGRAIEGTVWQRVWNERFMYCSPQFGHHLVSPLYHLSWLSRHPMVEYMLKMGFVGLVAEKLRMTRYDRDDIKWDAKSAEEAFGMDKATIRQLRPFGEELTKGELMAFRRLTPHVPQWPVPVRMDYIREMELRLYIGNIIDLCKERRYRLRDELKYLRRQMGGNRVSRYTELRDYWQECDLLGVPADDYRTRHPKDLLHAHREFSARIKHVKNALHDAAIKKNVDRNNELFAFAAEGLILRCAASSKEVIDEGTALSHCVGRYVEQYAKGNTVIMLLRRAEEPDKPWHTVEITPEGKVVQCRGYGNRTKPEDEPVIDAFWAAWKAEMRRRNGMEHAKAS